MPKKRKAARPSPKASSGYSSSSPGLAEINRKLDRLLSMQSQLLAKEEVVAREEEKVLSLTAAEGAEEHKLEEVAEKELSELEQLKAMEKRIQSEVSTHPLRKITFRDFTKGMIGAFIGIVAHFSFLEGLHVAENFTMFRATLLYLISLLIGIAFLYFAGFRYVGDRLVLRFIPLRIVVIYFTAILVVLLVLWLFGSITLASHFSEVYKTVSAISILAILGACTADLIGKGH